VVTNDEKEAPRSYNKRYHKIHSVRLRANARRAHLKRFYNITPEEFDAMVMAQNGRCGICDVELELNTHKTHVDHNHLTGQVRGVLCCRCNWRVGLFENSPAIMDKVRKWIYF
jgi:hypothetical protein